MSASAVVFDLDGVIVKTNFVKHAAMLSLFGEHSEQQNAISQYILSNGGVPRKVKLTHLLRNVLDTEPTETLLSEYLHRYAIALEHQLPAAPMVDGVGAFIASCPGARYVCSSAPEAEVHAQLARGSLATHLTAIHAGAASKSHALMDIVAMHAAGPVVFFGDSVGDYEAACEAGIAFVGVVCERNNFQGTPVVVIKDFSDRAAVEQAMLQSVTQSAAFTIVRAGSQDAAASLF
jgi:phosphoglycolate phosphatase-like HAD superfamily hydrolase